MSLALSPDFYALLADNYLRLIGVPLLNQNLASADAARWLYEDAPFCLLSANADPDPRYVYANRTAQRCFEYTSDELAAMPSRLSAEPANREERDRLLESVRTQGFVSGYRGLRIAKSGRRFWIENVTVWNLVDREGVYRGQAATFAQWTDI